MFLSNSFIDFGFGIGLFVNAMLFIPQAIRLMRVKDAKELSLLTFAGFNLIMLFSMMHAYARQDYVFFWGSVVSFITCGAVTVQIIVYKLRKKV